MFCENDALRAKVEAAAKASGERVWRLPMHQEYRDMMKSPVADILNSNPNRKAHPIQGAAFLSYFVDEKVPWCHLDIAGVHVAEKNAGMWIDGPDGLGRAPACVPVLEPSSTSATQTSSWPAETRLPQGAETETPYTAASAPAQLVMVRVDDCEPEMVEPHEVPSVRGTRFLFHW
jgi:hypothetical protein